MIPDTLAQILAWTLIAQIVVLAVTIFAIVRADRRDHGPKREEEPSPVPGVYRLDQLGSRSAVGHRRR